jgi:hypothetical protein
MDTQTAPVTTTTTRPGVVIGISALIGIAIAVLWSAQLVDDDIGLNTANGLLGQNASSAALTSTVTSLAFAFVTGLAGTFTACNIAVFTAITPLVGHRSSLGGRLAQALCPLGRLALGAVVVASLYGGIGALLGDRLPQLSGATIGNHIPIRLVQSIVAFGVIGLIMIYLGLAALHVVPDPLARLTLRWPGARQVVLGVLVGGFLIGRPWPLFDKMFRHAASTHNALFGAATFVLIVLGNMIVMGLLFLLASFSNFPRWLRATPTRAATATAVALLVGGTFTFVYWAVRAPSGFGIGWFPRMPWH